MKRCPYCDEEVRDNAVKCRHCGSMLTGRGTDTLDKAVTIPGERPSQQYDTLDAAATQGKDATILASQYRIIKKVGEGGMGIVYLAEDMEMGNRPVAVKVLPPLLSRNIRAVENLRKEAITAINLDHPNIIRLYGFHSDGDIKFLVMEYIEGQTLEEKIIYSEKKKLTLEKILPIAEQIAAALDYAHNLTAPVFHRDLKPSNVMIDKRSQVKLLDFGIAREMKDSYTRVTGQETSGTVPYMSPQQINGDTPNPAMDIYSFGVTLYECMAGHTPFYTGDIKHQILNKQPPKIEGLPGHVNSGLQKALAKDPSRRPKNAETLYSLLAKKARGTRIQSKTSAGSSRGLKIMKKGVNKFESGDFIEAENLLRKAVEANPSLWNAHLYLGKALSRQDKFDDAIIHLEIADEQKPDDEKIILELVGAYEQNNLKQACLAKLNAILQKQPKAGYHIRRRMRRICRGEHELARKYFDSIYDLPSPPIRLMMGFMGLMLGSVGFIPDAPLAIRGYSFSIGVMFWAQVICPRWFPVKFFGQSSYYLWAIAWFLSPSLLAYILHVRGSS